jgi:hypothetical protein
MHVLKPAAAYFALVFGAGFVLGAIRVSWIVSRIGARAAVLLETPAMLAVSVLAARWTNRRLAAGAGHGERFAIGLIALGLMLGAELAVGVALRGARPAEALLERDPVSGTAYYLALGVFAILPWLLGRRAAGAG